jgi:hypothetical protein
MHSRSSPTAKRQQQNHFPTPRCHRCSAAVPAAHLRRGARRRRIPPSAALPSSLLSAEPERPPPLPSCCAPPTREAIAATPWIRRPARCRPGGARINGGDARIGPETPWIHHPAHYRLARCHLGGARRRRHHGIAARPPACVVVQSRSAPPPSRASTTSSSARLLRLLPGAHQMQSREGIHFYLSSLLTMQNATPVASSVGGCFGDAQCRGRAIYAFASRCWSQS